MYFSRMANDGAAQGAMFNMTPIVFDVGSIAIPSWLLLWASKEFRDKWSGDCLPRAVRQAFQKHFPTRWLTTTPTVAPAITVNGQYVIGRSPPPLFHRTSNNPIQNRTNNSLAHF